MKPTQFPEEVGQRDRGRRLVEKGGNKNMVGGSECIYRRGAKPGWAIDQHVVESPPEFRAVQCSTKS